MIEFVLIVATSDNCIHCVRDYKPNVEQRLEAFIKNQSNINYLSINFPTGVNPNTYLDNLKDPMTNTIIRKDLKTMIEFFPIFILTTKEMWLDTSKKPKYVLFGADFDKDGKLIHKPVIMSSGSIIDWIKENINIVINSRNIVFIDEKGKRNKIGRYYNFN